jgi:tetratricopeptide (TPR) repeat protein
VICRAALLLILVLAAHGGDPPTWVAGFQSGLAKLKSGDVEGALNQFRNLWASNTGDAQLATSIGGALDSTSHHDQATAWYERALKAQPDFEPALNDLALNYAVQGKLTDAARTLRAVLRLNPENVKAAYNLGLVTMRLGSYDEAAKAFRLARESSNAPAPYSQLRLAEATALFYARQYSQVVALLNSAAEGAASLELLGSAQALSGEIPGAISTLQKAARLFPDQPQVYFRLAIVFAQGRRDQDAESVLDAGLNQKPGSPLLLYGKALVCEMGGRDDEAIRWAERSVHTDEKQPDVWGLLGMVYERSSKTEEALNAYQHALAVGPKPYFGAKYAEMLIRLDRIPEAEGELKQLQRQYPGDADVNRAFGKLFRAEKQFDRAEMYLRRSIATDSSDPQAHYALAQVLEHQGRIEDAKKEFAIYKNAKEKSESVRILERVEGDTAPAF